MQNVTRSDQIDLLLYDKATPSTLFRPQTRLNVLAGGIFGVVLGAILVFLLEYLDDTLKTQEDVERILSMPVVGMIPTLSPGDVAALSPRARETQPHEVA
jgi:capsular polysaccharide biosynthesis protein